MSHQRVCNRLASIIGGTAQFSNGVCVVSRLRRINVRINGRRSRSPLTLPFALSFENPDRRGRTLNLGESVVLEREINPLLTALRRRGITVTAVHNHWLFQNPQIMYMHWQSIDNPANFARKSAAAAREARLF